jgi:hypothetical protein
MVNVLVFEVLCPDQESVGVGIPVDKHDTLNDFPLMTFNVEVTSVLPDWL